MPETRFFGRVLRPCTHDMQNILAIIKESCLLIDDVLRLNGPPRMKHGDKIQTALATVAAQVERGRGLMEALNACAHAASGDCRAFDPALLCARAALLAERGLRLRQCGLEIILPENSPCLNASGFAFLRAVHGALESVAAQSAPGDRARLELAFPAGGGAEVRIGAQNSRAVPQADDDLKDAVRQCGGALREEEGALALSFPAESVQ